MRKIYGIFRPILLLLLCVLPARADPIVEIFGNHIFDDDAILRMAGFVGSVDPPSTEIRRRLETTGLFANVTVRETSIGKEIIVREKIPGFVLPFFFNDSQSSTYGAAAGVFGIANEDAYLVSRYQGGKDHLASLLYRNDFFDNSRWILGGSIEYENTQKDIYHERDVVDSTANKMTSYSALVGYHIKPSFNLEMNTHVEVHNFQDLEKNTIRGTQVSHRVMGKLGSYFIREGLARGQLIRPYFEVTSLGSFHFLQAGFFAQKSMYLRDDFNWIFMPRAEWGNPQPRYQLFELGAGRLRSFPAQIFRSNAYAAVQNDVLLTSLDFLKLKFRPLLYTDWAYIEKSGRTGVGAGLQIYFPKVVAPALQFYAGYGFNPKGFAFIVAVGPQL